MNMGDDKRLTGEERQLLVAYLDNEVPEEVAAMIESKIAGSASARREVEELKQAWDLLDFLPMPEASNDFSNRTMEVLTQADAKAGLVGAAVVDGVRRIGAVAAGVLAVVGSFFVGVTAVSFVPDQNRQIVQELPVLEHLDEYQAVRTITFLERLRTFNPLDNVEDPFKQDAEVPESE